MLQNELGALPDFVPTPIRLATPTETKVLTNHRNWVLTVQLLPRIPYALQAAGGGPSTRLRPSLRTCTAHLCDCRPIESVSRSSKWSDGLFPSGPCAIYYYKPVCTDAPRVQCSLDSLRWTTVGSRTVTGVLTCFCAYISEVAQHEGRARQLFLAW